jgi:hypothetical protein
MVHAPHADLAVILGCDVSTLGTAQAISVLHALRRLNGRLHSFEAAVNNRLSELHEQGGGAPAWDVLARTAHLSAKEAARRERRAKALANTKAFGDALARGDVAAEHADVLADLTAKVTDEVKASFFDRDQDLVAKASSSSPEQFARHCRTVIARLERDQGLERNQQHAATRISASACNATACTASTVCCNPSWDRRF